MGSTKNAGAMIGALVPVAYCGAMAYYFFGVSGSSVHGVAAMGLGPTVLGLGAIGLLCCVPLIFRIWKLVGTPPPKTGARSAADISVEEEAFDADAALARYLARKAAGGDEPQTQTYAEPESAASAPGRPAFGRKLA